MGWTLNGTPKTMVATPKIAKEFAEMEAAKVDRPLSERRLAAYRRMVAAGAFRPVTWAKAYCEETDQYYRVNGKHTSTIFNSLTPEELSKLVVVVEDYTCDTIEDVARLYSTFDSAQQTRNASDVNRAFAAMIPEFAELEGRIVNLLVSGLAYYVNPNVDQSGIRTQAERAELLFDYTEVCLWAISILGSARNDKVGHLWRAPVVAAMVATWHKNRKDATEFWEMVRDETGASPETPDRKLAKFLITSKVKQHDHTPLRFRALPKEFYTKSIYAWNAWRKGEKTNLRYSPTAKIPHPV